MIPFDQIVLGKVKYFSCLKKHEESCGLIYQINNKIKVYPCKNLSSDPRKNFLIDPYDYELCNTKGKIIACYHSHHKEGSFSYEDIKQSYKNNLSYLLYNIKKDCFYYFDPIKYSNYKKYIGLDFSFGHRDCFSLVLDFYRNELNINIYDPASNRELKYNPPINNLICDRVDFKKWIEDSDLISLETDNIKDFKVYDMLVFDGFRTGEPTHFGLFLENDMLLHHKYNQKSEIEPLRKAHFKYFKYFLRHKNFV